MKKNEVKVGGTYLAKVSGKVVPVRITGESPHGGWDATNVGTKKAVRIKSAQRLRGPWRSALERGTAKTPETPKTPAATGSALAEDKLSEGTKQDLAAVREKAAAPDPKLDADIEAAKKARAEKKAKKGQPKERRPSLLNLAYEVLVKAKQAMGCDDVVKEVLASGKWTTSGKTPAATLYAAIIREISAKGKDARFVKTGKNLFEAVAAAK